MNQKNYKLNIGKLSPKKRRGVAEVISTLLLVAITVVGAVILTSFIDESFVSGSLAVTSGSDTTIKTIRLLGYDTRNGDELMAVTAYGLNNLFLDTLPDVPPNVLCRVSCDGDPNKTPFNGGSDFIVLQVENRSLNPVYLKNIVVDGVDHVWDSDTVNVDLDTSVPLSLGEFPRDGTFSILSSDTADLTQGDRQVNEGETVNLLIKLDTTNDNIELSKTARVQVNFGETFLADFLIETGDAR